MFLGSWEEANGCYIKAQFMWRICRRWNAPGENALVDENLEEIRVELEELEEALGADENRPKEYDVEKAVAARVRARDEAVEDEKAMTADENPDLLRKLDGEARKALRKADEEAKMALRPKRKVHYPRS